MIVNVGDGVFVFSQLKKMKEKKNGMTLGLRLQAGAPLPGGRTGPVAVGKDVCA